MILYIYTHICVDIYICLYDQGLSSTGAATNTGPALAPNLARSPKKEYTPLIKTIPERQVIMN